METVKIERLIPAQITQTDFDRIVQLEAGCGLPDPYPPELIQEILLTLDTFVARIGGEIAGFIMINENGRYFGGSVYIVNLNVEKSFRRQGIARRLLLAVCRFYLVKKPDALMSLDVTQTNPALHLYQRCGFRRTILASRNGKSDIVMAAPLNRLCRTIEASL